MDSVFEQLRKFVENNFDIRIGDPDFEVQIDPTIPQQASYDYTTRTLSLRLNPDDVRIFGPILRGAIQSGVPLVEKRSKETVEAILTEEKVNADLLQYLKDKIPSDDFHALRAALYIRTKFREGSRSREIHALKLEIVQRYGSRGKSISNLCSSGYFETLIVPMYREMVINQGSPYEAFLKAYNFIIDESAFAVFISSDMSFEEVEHLVTEKIKRNSKYGIRYVSMHGIGRVNIDIIRAMIDILDKRYSIRKKDVIEKDNIITARIYFN